MRKVVPEARVELATPRFSAACSTTELPRQLSTHFTFAARTHARQTIRLPLILPARRGGRLSKDTIDVRPACASVR